MVSVLRLGVGWTSARNNEQTNQQTVLVAVGVMVVVGIVLVLPTPTVIFSGICLSVRLCVFFRMMSQKPIQLESPNLIQNCSNMSPVNLGSKGKRWRSRSRQCRRGCLRSCECRLILAVVECEGWLFADICSVWHCWLGDAKGIRSVKTGSTLDLCLWYGHICAERGH